MRASPNTGPGLRITDAFSDIVACSSDDEPYLDVDPLKFADKAALLCMCADAIATSGLRFVHAVMGGGRALTVDGEDLQRQRVYALVPLGQEAEAVRGVVQFIANKHGPGQLWTHGGVPIGPLKRREQDGYRGMQVGGVLHVVMGCYYYHKPVARRPYAPGEKMTDRHPDSVIAQVVEETIAARNDGPPCDRCGKPTSRGLEAWAARHQACSPYAPAPVSPELLAHRDYLVRETHEAMGMPADVFRCGIGSTHHSHRCERPAGHADVHVGRGCSWGEDAVPRPDGFDQHQVDAAKAALLAPVPPRYPRAR